MDLIQWYAISLGILIFVLFIYALSFSVFIITRFFLGSLLHSYYFCFTIPARQVLLLIFFLGGNIFCTLYQTKSFKDISTRACSLAAINLIPLYLGGKINRLTNFLGLNYNTYTRAHSWLGIIVLVQVLIHSISSFKESQNSFSIIVSLIPFKVKVKNSYYN